MFPRPTATGRFELAAIDTVDQQQFAFRQFPQVHMMDNGDWVVTFCWTDDAHFAKSGLLRSTDRGRTWTRHGWSTDSGVLVKLGGSRAAMFDSFYPLHKGGDEFAVQACFSDDHGRTFGPPELSLPVRCPGAEVFTLADMLKAYFTLPCFPWNRFFKANGYPPIAPGWPETAERIRFGGAGPSSQTLRLPDGRLLSMNYYKGAPPPDAPPLPAGYWVCAAFESSDGGMSWRRLGAVPWSKAFGGEGAVWGNAGFTEAGLARLDDGELLIVIRVGSGLPLATSRSSDEGRTWSLPEAVRFVTPATGNAGDANHPRGVLPVMVKMSTGMLACVYGRPGIHLMADRTGTGRAWEHEIDLKAFEAELCIQRGAPADFYSTENVGLAEVAPGELAVTYDLAGWTESQDKAWVRQTIRMARVRVRG